jgi:prostaglandin-endoperoxide synthase 2
MKLLDIVARIFRTFPFLRQAKWVRKLVTQFAVHEATKAVPVRPYPYCMRTKYTSWEGLIDRRISGRHIECFDASGQRLPPIQELASIFKRKQVDYCPRSSMLFAAFAQWFTDSFLRTSHGLDYDESGNAYRDKDDRLKRRADRHVFNDSNHEIDLCQIYGINEEKTSILRKKDPLRPGLLDFEMRDGEMYPRRILDAPSPRRTPLNISAGFRALHDEKLLRVIFEDVDKNELRSTNLFAVGLEHGNVTMGNSLFNTIFLREHNRLAPLIAEEIGNDDNHVFQTTRNVLTVMLLKIIIEDYIPHISPANLPLGLVQGYADSKPWYRPNRITFEFNLLYRWHELIPDELGFIKPIGDYRHNNNWMIKHGADALVEALSKERAGKITLGNYPEWLHSSLSETLKMMRDSQFAPYVKYRARFDPSRPEPKDFGDVTSRPELRKALETAYPDGVESLEWFVGMYAEDFHETGMMSRLMLQMVAYDAFTHALTNPLLAKGIYGEKTLSRVGMQWIERTRTLRDLVARNVKNDKLLCSFVANPPATQPVRQAA